MKQSKSIAIGGIFAALALMVMLLSYTGILIYIVPLIAGLFMVIVKEETSTKWALMVFATVGLLSLLLVNKESAMIFVCFFGYYPVLKPVLDKKISFKWLRITVKLLLFSVMMTLSFSITTLLLGIPLNENGAVTTIYILYYVLIFLLMFVADEFCINETTLLYKKRLKSKFSKIMNK